MASLPRASWKELKQTYLVNLGPKDARSILCANPSDHPASLVSQLYDQYSNRLIVKQIRRLQPVLLGIYGLREVVGSFTQFDPQISSLVWGSISFIVTLAIHHAKSLDKIVLALEKFQQSLPRFQDYIGRCDPDKLPKGLEVPLLSYCQEFFDICENACRFLRRRPLLNILTTAFRSFNQDLESRLQRLRDLTTWVDTQALLIILDDHHEQVLQHLQRSQLRQPSMQLKAQRHQNLPFPPNSSFQGRVEILNQLKTHLQPGSRPNGLKKAVLYGLGGVGKTQLALKFAWDHIQQYDTVLWITAESEIKLAESYGQAAHCIGALVNVQRPDQLRETLKEWLTSKSTDDVFQTSWLLIFDNVCDSVELEPYIPHGSNGTVVLTTRDLGLARQLSRPPERFAVPLFTVQESSQFLLDLVLNHSDEQASAEDARAAVQIAASLGWLPLALHLVGSHIAYVHSSLSVYLPKNGKTIRQFVFAENTTYPVSYTSPISTTWTLRLDMLPSASQLLADMVAFLDADGVPLYLFEARPWEDMIRDGPDEDCGILEQLVWPSFNTLAEKVALELASAPLINNSTFSKHQTTGHLICHRLVQEAIVSRMTDDQKLKIFSLLVFMLNAAFPQQSTGSKLNSEWEACARISSQVSTLLNNFTLIQVPSFQSPLLICDVALRCAWFHLEKGQFSIARRMTGQSLEIVTDALISGNHNGYSTHYIHFTISFIRSVQASIAFEAQAPESGLDLWQEVRQIRGDYARHDDQEDIFWLKSADGNVAAGLMAENRPEEALSILQWLIDDSAVKANRDVYLENICTCLKLLDRLHDALVYSTKALQAAEETRGQESEQVAQVRFIRGTIFQALRDLDQASIEVSECFRIRQIHMPKHHYTGLTAHKLGELDLERGRAASAIVFFQEALSILKGSEYHVGSYCRTAFALSIAQRIVGNSTAARNVETDARRERENIPGWRTGNELGTDPQEYAKFVHFAHR